MRVYLKFLSYNVARIANIYAGMPGFCASTLRVAVLLLHSSFHNINLSALVTDSSLGSIIGSLPALQ